MKNLSIVILVFVLAVVLGFYMLTFQVRETEKALVVRFGEPVRTKDAPGLYWKWPKPIEVVHKFDSRAQLFEGINNEETTTRGSEPIIVTSYLVWSVADPLRYLQAVGDKKGAEDQLSSLLRNAQNSVIGQHYFSEFVNSDRSKIRFAEIEEEMLDSIKPSALHDYGIEIRTVGIKQLAVNKEVTKDVFERMKADRRVKSELQLAEGEAEATRIRSEADMKKRELLAVAEAQAKAIKGAGDAEAAKYYKELEADPELALFLRDIEALEKILKEKSTIVLGADTEPMQLLREAPDISSSR